MKSNNIDVHNARATSHRWRQTSVTHKTKLKLDKEVGGRDLAELRTTITMRIVYPYAWTINFEICIQNTPTSDSNNFSSWSLE